MSKYLFLTSCGNDKHPECLEREMPLYEMYTGQVYRVRSQLLNLVADEVYVASLLGLGIVRETDSCLGYYHPVMVPWTPYLNDPEFFPGVRRKFEERYPGITQDISAVLYLGDSSYIKPLEATFPDIPVRNVLTEGLSVGQLRSLIMRVLRELHGVQDSKSKFYYLDGWLFEWEKYPGGNQCNLYQDIDGHFLETNIFDKSQLNFIQRFRELTGGLSTLEYLKSVGAPGRELTHPIMEKYFKQVLMLNPTIVNKNLLIKVDYISQGPFIDEFKELLLKKKGEKDVNI